MAYLISLGKQLPGWTGPRQERGHFNIDFNGPRLDLCFRKPTAREIRGAQSGRVRLGIVPAGRHTAFFLYDVEYATTGWADASYALGLLTPEERELPKRASNEGWLMTLLMVDADTGIVHSLRQLTMTPAFSDRLDGIVEAQRAALPDFTPQAHFAEIDAAYRRWPKPSDMVEFSVATERAGLPFQKFK